MTSRSVQITAEWAIHGQTFGRDGSRILACSTGDLSMGNFTEVIGRFSPGTPEAFPQVTISYLTAGTVPSTGYHVGLAIHKRTNDTNVAGGELTGRDDEGGPGAVTNYFCMPYAQLASNGIGYHRLYAALDTVPLPPVYGPPLTVPVEVPAPYEFTVDPLAQHAAALLLTGPVCVLGAESTSMTQRLRFIDAVMAMLPYGFRTRMTAATWVRATHRDHRFRLFFSGAKRDTDRPDQVLYWNRPDQSAALVLKSDYAYDYAHWLQQAIGEPMKGLAQLKTPRSFNRVDVFASLDEIGFIQMDAEEKAPLQPSPPPAPIDPLETVLLGCIAELDRRNTGRSKEYITALRIYAAHMPEGPEERGRYRQIVADRQLLTAGRVDEFYDMVLELAFGTPLDYQSYCQIEDSLSKAASEINTEATGAQPDVRPHRALLNAIKRTQRGPKGGYPDIRVSALVAYYSGNRALTDWVKSGEADGTRLIASLAARWDRPEHAGIVEDVTIAYLRGISGTRRRQDARDAFRAHGYLASALQKRYPGHTQRQAQVLTGILHALYPEGLDAGTARAILDSCAWATTAYSVVFPMIGDFDDRMEIEQESRTRRAGGQQ